MKKNQKTPILNTLKSGRIITSYSVLFSHPDFTVGFGIAPNQSLIITINHQ
jgi:hypothetical protein